MSKIGTITIDCSQFRVNVARQEAATNPLYRAKAFKSKRDKTGRKAKHKGNSYR